MNKKALIFFALLVLLALSSCTRTEADNVDVSEIPISVIEASWLYDIYNVNKKVGVSDYVFVADVITVGETEYRSVWQNNEDGEIKTYGDPYTHFTVKVVDNIKGSLITGESIELVKDGGVSMDKSVLVLYEGDKLPEQGKRYIFLATAQNDGSLLISGPTSNPEYSDELCEQYREAYRNEEVPLERPRFSSRYDSEK